MSSNQLYSIVASLAFLEFFMMLCLSSIEESFAIIYLLLLRTIIPVLCATLIQISLLRMPFKIVFDISTQSSSLVYGTRMISRLYFLELRSDCRFFHSVC